MINTFITACPELNIHLRKSNSYTLWDDVSAFGRYHIFTWGKLQAGCRRFVVIITLWYYNFPLLYKIIGWDVFHKLFIIYIHLFKAAVVLKWGVSTPSPRNYGTVRFCPALCRRYFS